jgi:vacuolar-type H+-ATPase subunit D/Vma8
MTKKQLLELKEKIDVTKSEVATLKGRQDYLMQQLQEQWDCKTIKMAEKKVEELQVSIDNIDIEIEKGINELKSKYNVY